MKEITRKNQVEDFSNLAYQKLAMIRKILLTLFSLVIAITSYAQDISYDELSSIDWNDYPFSLVELLLEKDFEFVNQDLVNEMLETEGAPRETFYQLTYSYTKELNLLGAAYVIVDEANTNSIPSSMPVLKIRFWHQNKNEYIRLGNEIKSACGEPINDFFIGENASAFIIDKDLIDGEPNYYINFYHITKEELEEMKKLSDQILEIFKDE